MSLLASFQQSPPSPPTLPGFEAINRFWDKRHRIHSAKILPGEYYVSKSGELISTVLGSCVSACVRDPEFGVGGMNHFMLPAKVSPDADSWSGTTVNMATRYGNFAMEHLINDVLSYGGGQRRNLEFKLIGGGRVLAGATDVGRRNIEFVRSYLVTEGFSALAEDLGGTFPRKVLYYSDTGRVRVKKLRELHNDTVHRRETDYMHQLEDGPVAGEVDLF